MFHLNSPEWLLSNMPPVIADAVHEVATNVQAPVEIAMASALAAASFACQFRADVVRQEHLSSPVSLNFLTIADSGDRKTGCDKHFTKPITAFEASLQEGFADASAQHRTNLEMWQIKRTNLVKKIKKLDLDGQSTDQEATALRSLDAAKPKEPLLPKFIFADVTPEALANRFEAWPSIGITSNDAGSILGTASMQNLGMLNQIWDGTPPRIERVSRDTKPIAIARLTMSLMVQAETLGSYLRNQGSLARSNGFLARALISQPNSLKGQRFITSSVEPAWRHLPVYQERLSQILKDGYQEQCKQNYRPEKLMLERNARTRWKDFSNEVERSIQPGARWSEISDAASKAPEQAVRLAGLFHLIEGHEGEISERALAAAINIIEYYLGQFELIFGSNSPLSPLNRDVAMLRNFLTEKFRARGETQFTRSWIMRNVNEPLRSRARLHPALEVLYDERFVRLERIDGTYWVRSFLSYTQI